jgi:methylated-DNA-protein-cysteine methyltransferase-like protein
VKAAATGGTYARIYAVVRRIPRGRVATYGQVAVLAGLPGHARQVGYALSALGSRDGVPWQRVVNARGEVSPRGEVGWDEIQRSLLEDEGVEVDARGRIDLRRSGWRPRRTSASRPRFGG